MKSKKQIKDYFILFIMLLGMMHNAFPHVHHQHDEGDAVVSGGGFHHHEHHGDHHHHPGMGDQDHEQNGFLDFLFENHSHSKHSHQYTPATLEQVKAVKQLGFGLYVNSVNWSLDVKHVDTGLHRYILFEDLAPKHSYLPPHPHRGPPSLG